MYLFYLALTYLKSGQLREHLRDLIPLYPSELSRLTSKSTRSFSEFGETRAPWLVA